MLKTGSGPDFKHLQVLPSNQIHIQNIEYQVIYISVLLI